jgi:hypothetical protein
MEALFDHEKLDVYRVELQFIAWLADFFDEVSQSSVQHHRELLEQLDRASLSALLNTAEGNGKRRGASGQSSSMTRVARRSNAQPALMLRSRNASYLANGFVPEKRC